MSARCGISVSRTRSRRRSWRRAAASCSTSIARTATACGSWWRCRRRPSPVFFLNFKMEGEFSKFRTDVILADRSTGRMFSDKIRQVYLELPYFPRGSWEECENDFERWIYLLKHMETLERMPERLRKSVFERLLEVADVASLTKEERVLYDEALKRYRDYKNTVEYAEEKGRLSLNAPASPWRR